VDANQRAIAAQIIAYPFNKAAIIPDLIEALRDSNEQVRNNAMRALALMAAYNQKHAESMLRIPYEPFIALLSSPVWTDRNKAAFVLMSLSASRDPMMLHQIRSRAFAELAEMAQWQVWGHAMPAALILGRLAGIPDAEIMTAFQNDRAALIEAARGRP
jgi:HEAT repeat protein